LEKTFVLFVEDEPGWWEQVDVESFFDVLEPGEYILEIETSWGNSRGGWLGQYFLSVYFISTT